MFIPTRDGSIRAIGLYASFMRWWMRVRRPVLQAWEAANRRAYFVGVCRRSDGQANWEQAFADERAHMRGLASAAVLLDVRKRCGV